MSGGTYTGPFLLTGDMVATLSGGPWNQGNPGDANFGIVLPDTEAVGTSDQIFRLRWHQNTNSTSTEFGNGQFWCLETYSAAGDPDGNPATGDDGWALVPGYSYLTPGHDLVGGLGAGDEYVVLGGGPTPLLVDINGGLPTEPTTLVYLASDEQGDLAKGDNDGQLDFADAASAFCFEASMRVATPLGLRAVGALAIGDMVVTRDHGAQALRWIGRRRLSVMDLLMAPHLAPVALAPGALGPGMPRRELVVSPQHRLLVRSTVARRMFGEAEVLVAAKDLLGLPGIRRRAQAGEVTYVHLAFDRHEIVFAEGAEAESFYPGAQAMRSLSEPARRELLDLLPDLKGLADHLPTRPIVSGRRARRLAERHVRNARPLVA